jgi:hypothetical protein
MIAFRVQQLDHFQQAWFFLLACQQQRRVMLAALYMTQHI